MQPPPTPPYLVKNFILTIKAEWMLDKTTLELTRDSMDSLKAFQESDGQLSVENILQEYVTDHGHDIYSVPLFTEEFCSTMLDVSQTWLSHQGFHRSPNTVRFSSP